MELIRATYYDSKMIVRYEEINGKVFETYLVSDAKTGIIYLEKYEADEKYGKRNLVVKSELLKLKGDC